MTFGNNDCKYHDNAPPPDDKIAFYSEIYDLWFVNHPGNSRWNTAQTKATFLDGGYYTADFSDDVSVMSVNTLEYNTGQQQSWVGPEQAN